MSDKEARILGAGSSIEIDGKEYKLNPINLKQLMEIQREAVSFYKRQYLKTFVENADLLPEGSGLIEKKLEEVARWDIKDCPVRFAYSCAFIRVTQELKDRITEILQIDDTQNPQDDDGWRSLTEIVLDREEITSGEINKLTKTLPMKEKVAYDMWWVTSTWEGLNSMVWASMSSTHSKLTKDQVSRFPLNKLMEAAKIAEKLTTPDSGNT